MGSNIRRIRAAGLHAVFWSNMVFLAVWIKLVLKLILLLQGFYWLHSFTKHVR